MKNREAKIGSIIRYLDPCRDIWRYGRIVKVEGKKIWAYWSYNVKKVKIDSFGFGWMSLKDIEIMEDNPNNDILL